ncbi:hypothetical protein [Microcoleus sp. herbarium14]
MVARFYCIVKFDPSGAIATTMQSEKRIGSAIAAVDSGIIWLTQLLCGE